MEISEKVKRNRIDFLKIWPLTEQFPCEKDFENRLKNMGDIPVFHPVTFQYSIDNKVHTVISYVIEALDCLPHKPDNAFDWFWKAFEYCISNQNSQNLTLSLQNYASDLLSTPNNGVSNGSKSLLKLTKEIPFQTCEYLFKKLATDGFFAPLPTGVIGKRTLLKNGNPPIVYPNLQSIINHLVTTYTINDHQSVRNAAAFIRRIIRQEEVDVSGIKIKLPDTEIHMLLVCTLTYTFRNDRTHAELFAPFRSSTATLTTYAHCWFMTMLAHCLLLTIVEHAIPDAKLDLIIEANTDANIAAYRKLFGDYRNK